MSESESESVYNSEEKIEEATNQIVKILHSFEEKDCNYILQKVKLYHLELKVASYEVQRLLESALQ
jgi:hypothetical protein